MQQNRILNFDDAVLWREHVNVRPLEEEKNVKLAGQTRRIIVVNAMRLCRRVEFFLLH